MIFTFFINIIIILILLRRTASILKMQHHTSWLYTDYYIWSMTFHNCACWPQSDIAFCWSQPDTVFCWSQTDTVSCWSQPETVFCWFQPDTIFCAFNFVLLGSRFYFNFAQSLLYVNEPSLLYSYKNGGVLLWVKLLSKSSVISYLFWILYFSLSIHVVSIK